METLFVVDAPTAKNQAKKMCLIHYQFEILPTFEKGQPSVEFVFRNVKIAVQVSSGMISVGVESIAFLSGCSMAIWSEQTISTTIYKQSLVEDFYAQTPKFFWPTHYGPI